MEIEFKIQKEKNSFKQAAQHTSAYLPAAYNHRYYGHTRTALY
jgi:hypothetical protein